MIKFTINNIELEAEEGTTILEAANEAGIKIPTLCYHKDLKPYGACRLCMVEITKRGWPSLQPACTYMVFDGLIVETDTERVIKSRKVIFELLLARCPDSENIKKLAAEYGVIETRITLADPENCAMCGLCVRVCAEISQREAISFAFRGDKRVVQTAFDKMSPQCVGCGACAYVCPTGRITVEEADD